MMRAFESPCHVRRAQSRNSLASSSAGSGGKFSGPVDRLRNGLLIEALSRLDNLACDSIAACAGVLLKLEICGVDGHGHTCLSVRCSEMVSRNPLRCPSAEWISSLGHPASLRRSGVPVPAARNPCAHGRPMDSKRAESVRHHQGEPTCASSPPHSCS